MRRDRRLAATSIALLEFTIGQIAVLIMPAMRTEKPLWPAPAAKCIKALIFSAIVLEELRVLTAGDADGKVGANQHLVWRHAGHDDALVGVEELGVECCHGWKVDLHFCEPLPYRFVDDTQVLQEREALHALEHLAARLAAREADLRGGERA